MNNKSKSADHSNLIISTCGTSVLTNLADGADRKLVFDHANARSSDDVPVDARNRLTGLIDTAKTKLIAADVRATKRASAELNGILSLADDRTPLSARDVHILIHTDTWLGAAAAEVIESKLTSFGVTPQLHRVASLNTDSRADFDDGLRNLVKWAADTLPGYREARHRVIFNLVGGFKSVQGFMQTLGMFHADETVYIFETGSELLRIPRLPVDLDNAARRVMTDHASAFRRLDILGPQSADAIADAIPESLLYHLNEEIELSPWGKLLWNAFKPNLYSQRLLDCPSPRMRFSDKFESDSSNLPKDRYVILNERIDDLMRFHEDPDAPNPKRLDVKKLKASPKPPSTHEADAWADADCRRVFFHYENDTLVVDRLDKALH
jgi:putative CRISPR-associated protein (TIGR02619 family)